ncbi:MAG TPA: glycosyltransferase family 2 protein [Candidatus Sulfotelmatobacter sp.]
MFSISIVIPTKNRLNDLKLTVETLLAQTVLPDQLVIVDQSSGDESECAIRSLLAQAPQETRDRVRLNYVLNPAITGGAQARNRAMDIADGAIWLFLDDDVYLEPDFIEQLLAAYRQFPAAAGVSGIVTNYSLPPWSALAWRTLFVRGQFHDDRQPVYWNASRLRGQDPVPVSRFGGGLMSFRAEAIRNVRFDENLSGVSDGEDVDFCAHLKPGSLLLITPKARLVHNQSPAGRSQKHWTSREAKSNHYLYYRNWRSGVFHRICFYWMNLGYGLVASFASLRRRSLQPWRDLFEGMRDGHRVSRPRLLPSDMGKTNYQSSCGRASLRP